ncbi:CRACD-like protein isoform X3 [Salvelinus namaycush]|uniref:CRACD-like protein isoform X3 n=1 Tax=Salvelinus namaycush TaxID=8040 RepID=A0A8U0QWL2_SALNM|nr:CRACD-like protein isoform X3 [Salvelinus namaycush]
MVDTTECSDCSIMASGPSDVMTNQDPADPTEECTGKKKSKFQTFKKFFAKKKRKEAATPAGDNGLKSSQSSDNVNAPEPAFLIRSEKDEGSGSKIYMGNKALSHDSVFVSDLPLSEVNEDMGAFQDSIHGNVKSLQLQLKQAIRLGSPPSPCVKGDDAGTLSEDDGLPCSPPEYSTLHAVLAGVSHRRNSSLSLEGTDSDEDQMSCEVGSRSVSPLVPLPVDFSQPASPMGCLDNTAARHRLAVRHKACSKMRKPTTRVDGRAEGESFQEERLSVGIPESVEEDKEEDVKCEQMGAAEKEQTDGAVVSQQAERSAPDKEEDEQGDQPEVSQDVSSSSPSIQNESDSEECLSGQAKALTQTAPLPGSLDSLEPTTRDYDDFLLAPTGCEAAEGGSLLQEVLSSLKCPLTSVLGLEAVPLEEVNVKGLDPESWMDELADEPEPLSLPSDPTQQEEASLPSDGPDCPAESQKEEKGEPYESEEEYVVEHFKPKEEEDQEEIKPEYLTKEDQDIPSVYMKKEEKVDSEEEEEREEEAAVEKKEEAEEVVQNEAEEKKKDVWREEEKTEPISEVPVQTALLEPEEEEDVTPTSEEDDAQQVPDNDTDTERACESPECPTELPDQTVREQACVSQLPNSSTPPPDSSDQPESPTHTTQDQEEPSVMTEQYSITSPSAASGPEQSPQEPCSGPTATEDHGKPSCGSEQSRPRFTFSPTWQRLATKEPTSPSTSPSPATSPSVTVPGAVEAGVTRKTDPPSRVEPLSPVVAEVPACPSRTQSTTAPTNSSKDTPPAVPAAQEEGTPENLFGVRLRKTSVGMLRLGSESETPPSSPAHSLPVEPQRASFTEPQPQSKSALLRKPSELDGIVKPKRTPDLSVGRVPSGGSSGGSESPSWISVARQKQRIFKENSLEETTEKKVPAEKGEPNRKGSIPTLTSPVNKDQAKPPGPPVKVLCSLEISKPAVVEKEGKKAPAHPAPTALAQDEPPWMALAKKKAKAWSEMPQIVQ